MKYLINVRGCNGSGKSTIPLSMMDDPDKYTIEKMYKGKSRIIATVFPMYGWVVLGSYHNKCGGLDGFVDTAMIIKVTWYALKNFPDFNILMEGVIPSTVYSTYERLFHEIQQSYLKRKVIVVNLLPPVEECFKRIQQRNGGKPIKEDLVASKHATVAKNADKFTKAGILSVKWDNSRVWPRYNDRPMIQVMMRYLKKGGWL